MPSEDYSRGRPDSRALSVKGDRPIRAEALKTNMTTTSNNTSTSGQPEREEQASLPTNPTANEPFGPVIFTYSRKDALADGVQIDVTATAREAGIRYPTFITCGVYQQYVFVPAGVEGQEEAGRLWDIVWMLRCAVLRTRDGITRIPFELFVRNDNRKARLVQLVAECSALDFDDPSPAITIMLPGED